MFAQVGGSSPSLPIISAISICAIKQLGEATIKVTVGNLIGTIKEKCGRMWCVINIIFLTIALCGICGGVSSEVEHVIKLNQHRAEIKSSVPLWCFFNSNKYN